MPRKNTRSSGVLLPLFAIPGGPDLGTLGKSALRFLDFLKNAKQTVFQTLPINPTDEAGSPYAGRSAFAGEPLYLDLEELRDEGLIADVLEEERASSSPKTVRTWARDVVDYPRAVARRKPLWNEAFQNYRDKRGGKKFRDQEERFRAENAFWLDDFALFQTAAERFETFKWAKWPEEIRRRDPNALKRFQKENADAYERAIFLQLVFDSQWRDFKNQCRERGVELFGDLPIYVGKESADVWANPELFMVDRDGRILREAGSPPDDYNPDGQRWSSPTYRWSRHFETNFDWWKKRMTKTIERFDTVRLDHFIGFYNYYAFPGVDARPEDDALWREEREKARQYATHPDDDYEDGWTPGPQEKFFDAIFEVAPREALVAEDLGVMNQGVRDLRDSLDLPGMRVLQFSFDSVAPGDPDPTREWPLRSVAYTGTHDGAPIVGWIDDVRRYGKRFWKTLDFDAVRDVLIRCKRPYDLPAPSRPTSLLARLRDLFRKDRPILGIAQYDRPAPLTVLELHAPALRSVASAQSYLAVFPIQDVLGLPNSSRINFPGVSVRAWEWRLPQGLLSPDVADFLAKITTETDRAPK